jgi:hypothetical protein
MKDLTLYGDNGGELTVAKEATGSTPLEYMHFNATQGHMYGVVANSPKLRSFLRKALRRLELNAAHVAKLEKELR